MKKKIKIIIAGIVIFIVLMALIAPKVRYYLRVGDIITIGKNMEKVAHALESFAGEASGKYPQSYEERTEETNELFETFLSKEKWYEPPVFPYGRDRFKPIKERSVNVRDRWCKKIRRKEFHKVIKFKPSTENIPKQIRPCEVYIYTDGVRYKIVGGDKNGFLVQEDISGERGASDPKIIYSDNYWK